MKRTLIDALRDENGLAPTEGAQTVLRAVLDTFDAVDAGWAGAGAPPAATYFAAVQHRAEAEYEAILRRALAAHAHLEGNTTAGTNQDA